MAVRKLFERIHRWFRASESDASLARRVEALESEIRELQEACARTIVVEKQLKVRWLEAAGISSETWASRGHGVGREQLMAQDLTPERAQAEQAAHGQWQLQLARVREQKAAVFQRQQELEETRSRHLLVGLQKRRAAAQRSVEALLEQVDESGIESFSAGEEFFTAQEQVEAVRADKKELEGRWKGLQKQGESWQARAEQASQAGDRELAEQALAHKQSSEQQAAVYHAEWEIQVTATQELAQALHSLRQRLDAVRNA